MDLRICALFLFLLSPQQSPKPETVALVFGPDPARIEFMQTDQAEKLYSAIKLKVEKNTATEDDLRAFAMLTQALGISPTQETAPELNTRDRLDWEIRRGVRKPLQKGTN